MAVDIEIIKKHGGDKDSLRKLFEQSREQRETTGNGAKVNRLIDLHKQRMQDGINRNLSDARYWWAIDQAYDATQRQISYTLVQGLLDKKPSSEEVLKAATDWGLTTMISPLVDKFGRPVMEGKNPAMKLDLPTFFQVFVPFVMAYTKIRWAKLFNDRDLYPFYKYEPLVLSTEDRLRTEIITHRIGRMTTEMGYRDDERQSIFQTLLYGICLNFPMEDYWRESQLVKTGSEEKEKVVREGVRFAMPHPSKMFYDQTHRPSTFNFDNGADYAGYWQIVRFGDVRNNENYWNRDKITWGGKGAWPWQQPWGLYSSLYPCALKFPSVGSQSDLNREVNAFTYSQADDDSAVNLVPICHKLNPKQWGLYDYDYPVWHRFIYAAEDTCIHCVPLAYSPVVAYLYDYDNNRSRNPSLALELLPWQDHIGNLLSQYLLSVKKNLTRVVFWNRDVLDDDEVREIRNLGEKMLQEMRMIPFSGKEMNFAQTGVQQAFFPVQFNPLNTSEIVSALNTTISIMERMLGFSSQELSSQATHEQSATETRIVAASTAVRMQFTGGFLDQGAWARKRLLYDAMMAYSDDDILAQIADLTEQKRESLEKIGFKIEKEDSASRRAGVRGKKGSLSIEGFASEREGANRIEDAKIAVTMIQMFQSVLSNPAIIESLGIEQMFDLINQVLGYAGVPKEFKVTLDPTKTNQQNAANAQDQMKQLAEFVVKTSKEVVANELQAVGETIRTQVVEPISQRQAATEEAVKAVAERSVQAEQAIQMMADKLAQVMQMVAQPPPPQQVPVPVPVPQPVPQPVPVPVPMHPGMMPPPGPIQ